MQHEQMRIHHLALIMNCAHFPKASWHKAPQHALTHQLIDSSPCRVANACIRDQSGPHNQVILCWLLLFDSLTQHYNIKCGVLCKHETLCPSGLRGWTQVPLARAAWVQIPQVSYLIAWSCVCASSFSMSLPINVNQCIAILPTQKKMEYRATAIRPMKL